VWGGTTTPAARVPLRSADPDSFTVVDTATGAVLGFVERSRAYSTVHEGAVYLHMGETYLVRELSEQTLHAIVEPFRGDWYTQPKKETATTILGPLRSEERLGLELVFGEVEVTDVVVGYERKTVASQERIELVPLVCPPDTFATEAVWFSPEPDQLRDLDTMPKLLSTLHAAEHALIAMLPLWAMCDRWDIGGLSTNNHPDTGRPTIFVYDGHPGGVGITERGFEQFEGWAADTAAMIAACPCADGCPSCVQSPKCGNLNEMLDKAGAALLLERLVASR
jgi:DEAD/DEAH box helicase domain-containing protein